MAEEHEEEYPAEGSAEWREKSQAIVLAPSPFKWFRDYEPEHGHLSFELKVGDWDLSIVPEWNGPEEKFDNFMFSFVTSGDLHYDGDDNWESLSQAQTDVETFVLNTLLGLMTDAFHSLPEGLNSLYEHKKHYPG